MSKKKVNKKHRMAKNINNNKPLLSIGLITKNEERCIERCLKSIYPLKSKMDCEIVLADTGSTDRTKEIAQKYADLVFDFKWINDFSAARNAVIDKSNGYWHMSIDGDEYLDESSVDEIANFFNSGKYKKYDIANTRVNHILDEDDYSIYSSLYIIKMFKPSSGIKYRDKIHETLTFGSRHKVYDFKNVFFWHDGYLPSSNDQEVKRDRNMVLLKEAIKQNPDDYTKVLQALESSRNDKEEIKYSRMFVELLKKGVRMERGIFASGLSSAIQYAYLHKLNEIDEWKDIAFKFVPNSIFTKVDVAYILALYENEKGNYDSSLRYLEQYFESLSREHTEDDREDLSMSLLKHGTKDKKEIAKLLIAENYAMLSKFEDAKKIIDEIEIEAINARNLDRWLSVAFILWDKLDLSLEFEKIYDFLYQKNENHIKKSEFEKATLKQFLYKYDEDGKNSNVMPKKPAFKLIASMGDSDISYQARFMLGENKAIDKISDWNNISPVVIERIVLENICLPQGFYDISSNKIKTYAVITTEMIKDVNILISWVQDILSKKEDTYVDIFVNRIFINLLHDKKWEKIDDKQYFINMYINNCDRLVNALYKEDLLSEQMINILPDDNAFGWLIVSYDKALKMGDLKDAIYFLRKALKLFSEADEFIKYLMNITNDIAERQQTVKKEDAPPELLMLAEKVKQILSAYPQDDPAVMAIKQSDAYKKVAYLIEDEEHKM